MKFIQFYLPMSLHTPSSILRNTPSGNVVSSRFSGANPPPVRISSVVGSNNGNPNELSSTSPPLSARAPTSRPTPSTRPPSEVDIRQNQSREPSQPPYSALPNTQRLEPVTSVARSGQTHLPPAPSQIPARASSGRASPAGGRKVLTPGVVRTPPRPNRELLAAMSRSSSVARSSSIQQVGKNHVAVLPPSEIHTHHHPKPSLVSASTINERTHRTTSEYHPRYETSYPFSYDHTYEMWIEISQTNFAWYEQLKTLHPETHSSFIHELQALITQRVLRDFVVPQDVWCWVVPGTVRSLSLQYTENSAPSLQDADWPLRIFVAVRIPPSRTRDFESAMQYFTHQHNATEIGAVFQDLWARHLQLNKSLEGRVDLRGSHGKDVAPPTELAARSVTVTPPIHSSATSYHPKHHPVDRGTEERLPRSHHRGSRRVETTRRTFREVRLSPRRVSRREVAAPPRQRYYDAHQDDHRNSSRRPDEYDYDYSSDEYDDQSLYSRPSFRVERHAPSRHHHRRDYSSDDDDYDSYTESENSYEPIHGYEPNSRGNYAVTI